MPRDSVGHTIKIALLLCVVCSVLVSGAAVGLRQRQQANKERERKANIISAAGLAAASRSADIEKIYEERIIERIVELELGEYTTEVEPANYDQRSASRDPERSVPIPAGIDQARIRRREKYALVYLVRNDEGRVDQIVLPIRGYGLWSTLWGFISLDAESIRAGPEAIAVRGLTFYEHGETPGLGGEVDNPRWKESWRNDKRIYDANWDVLLRVTKGTVAPNDPQADYKVDGLSGATITANGVTNMIEYWFGDHGFRPYLRNANQRHEMLSVEGGRDG